MKALTLTQPRATLVAIRAKRIETRSWQTRYRGPLAIHAGAGLGPVGGEKGLRTLCITQPFFAALRDFMVQHESGYSLSDALPRGAIVATCELAGVVRTEDLTFDGRWARLREGGIQEWILTDQERAFGNYTPGRFAWLLANVQALPEPIPAKGALGLWNWEEVMSNV